MKDIEDNNFSIKVLCQFFCGYFKIGLVFIDACFVSFPIVKENLWVSLDPYILSLSSQ